MTASHSMMLHFYFLFFFGLIFILILLSALLSNVGSTGLPLPPGPRGTFLEGVKRQLPRSEPWKTYAGWGKLYGGSLLSYRVYNRQTIVLNSARAIHDLLNARGNVYSDRPKSWMYQELCDRGKSVFNISSTDDRHKQYRKLLQTGLGLRATEGYLDLIESEIQTLLNGLAQTPEDLETHIRRNTAAVIMKVAYGYTVTKGDDFFIGAAEEAAQISGWAMAPGRWLVDYFPLVRFIPSKFPGAAFKRQSKVWRHRLNALSGVPHEWVKGQMASGTYIESFTSRLLQPGGPGKALVGAEEEDIIKWCAGGLYAGAADTTVSALLSFIYIMSAYPDIQRKAQAELDDILGPGSAPKAADLNQLPYLMAVMKELLRFAPVAPLALPHKVIQQDEYDGYRIPKNATIIANVWAVMNDATMYPNPDVFDPSRFLPSASESGPKSVQPDPRAWCFGFGRRQCPGSQFAETSTLMTMANILSKFTITCPSSKEGTPTIEFTTGITSHVKPFDIQISLRHV